MAKLHEMYVDWLEMMSRDSRGTINPLYHIVWMERVFGYSYQTCRRIFHMFMRWLNA